MKISIIGNNLTGLILAKALSNKNINVEIFYIGKSKKPKSNRTIAITNKNMNFVEKNLFHISKKFINPINEIAFSNLGDLLQTLGELDEDRKSVV